MSLLSRHCVCDFNLRIPRLRNIQWHVLNCIATDVQTRPTWLQHCMVNAVLVLGCSLDHHGEKRKALISELQQRSHWPREECLNRVTEGLTPQAPCLSYTSLITYWTRLDPVTCHSGIIQEKLLLAHRVTLWDTIMCPFSILSLIFFF